MRRTDRLTGMSVCARLVTALLRLVANEVSRAGFRRDCYVRDRCALAHDRRNADRSRTEQLKTAQDAHSTDARFFSVTFRHDHNWRRTLLESNKPQQRFSRQL